MSSSLAPSSLLVLLACPSLRCVRPSHRAAWGAFLGALFGVALDAESARRARRALRALEALAGFLLGVAELRRAAMRAASGWPSCALPQFTRDATAALGALPWGSLPGLDARAAAAFGAFWRGSPAMVVQDLDAETWRDARAFGAFVRRARRIARELEHGSGASSRRQAPIAASARAASSGSRSGARPVASGSRGASVRGGRSRRSGSRSRRAAMPRSSRAARGATSKCSASPRPRRRSRPMYSRSSRASREHSEPWPPTRLSPFRPRGSPAGIARGVTLAALTADGASVYQRSADPNDGAEVRADESLPNGWTLLASP